MAWTYGFFNSVGGDRTYNAEQMNQIFDGLIGDGIYINQGNKLAVQPNSGMTIQIATGRGRFAGHWVKNDAPYLQTLEEADVLLNRYCAVCVRVDETVSQRNGVPYFKYSEFATTPEKPKMTRTETVKEYCLAYVYIRAGAKAITAADIEDTRSNTSLCGWVSGLVEQLDLNTMYTQQDALFKEWFSSLVDIIDGNVETTLVNAMPVGKMITLVAGEWKENDGKYKQEITMAGITATKSVIVMPEDVKAYGTADIEATEQGVNTLTFTATTKPTEDINVKVLYMGV